MSAQPASERELLDAIIAAGTGRSTGEGECIALLGPAWQRLQARRRAGAARTVDGVLWPAGGRPADAALAGAEQGA